MGQDTVLPLRELEFVLHCQTHKSCPNKKNHCNEKLSFLGPFCLSELMLRCSLFPCLTSVTPASGPWKAARLQEWAWAHGNMLMAGQLSPCSHLSYILHLCHEQDRSRSWFPGLCCLWIPDRIVDLYAQEKTLCKMNGLQGNYRESGSWRGEGKSSFFFSIRDFLQLESLFWALLKWT